MDASNAEKTVLLIHPGSLGDILLALPAVRAVREKFPRHVLTLLAAAEPARLLQACGEVDAVYPLEGPLLAGLLEDTGEVAPVLADRLRRCELAVCWLEGRDGALQRGLKRVGVKQACVGSPHGSGCRAVHQSDRFLELLPFKSDSGPVGRPLRLPVLVRQAGRQELERRGASSRPVVMLHPGSGSRHKCAPPDIFASLVRGANTAGATPLLIGGPADDEAVARVSEALHEGVNVVQGLPLMTMAGLLAAADLYVGNDSGLTHLAAAFAVPTIALFGPTKVDRWAPRGPKVTVLSGAACRCESWERVRACSEKVCFQIEAKEVMNEMSRMLGPCGR
ncbi:glycosyltransferase family 9 protein [Candidatus Nitrospira bockiana]